MNTIDKTQPNEIEKDLAYTAELSVHEAQAVTIITSEDYTFASQLLIEHKKRIKAIKDYWDQPKSAAKLAHQALCDKEKAMLAPFTQAETIIKGAMVIYQRKVDDERRLAEQEARRIQQEEAERLMAKSIQAEESGDTTRANVLMAMATKADEQPIVSDVAAPRAAGISTRKVWKARVVDPKQIPAYSDGIELRPINMSALNDIARLTKGASSIPGVEFYEDVTISARA